MDSWDLTNLEKDSFGASSFTPRCSKKPQGVWCVVDGCTADLSGCGDYHRRHRVCETHSKTPVVTVAGKDQRFCQQCSRFHSLGEFDQMKRSCRKRLDGHNRRRRKPRAESMYLNYGRFFTNHPAGTKLLRFGGSPPYPDTVGPQHQQLLVQPSSYSGRKMKFPFFLDTSSEQVVNANASAHHMDQLSKRLTQLVEPKGALSLLSQHTGSSPSNLVQPMATNSHFCGALNQHLDPINTTVPNDNDHLIGMFHLQPQGMLENGASEFLSFSLSQATSPTLSFCRYKKMIMWTGLVCMLYNKPCVIPSCFASLISG